MLVRLASFERWSLGISATCLNWGIGFRCTATLTRSAHDTWVLVGFVLFGGLGFVVVRLDSIGGMRFGF